MVIPLSLEEIHRLDRFVLLQYWHHHCVTYQISADETGLGWGSRISNETVHDGVRDVTHS
jgi:hypothetical protein